MRSIPLLLLLLATPAMAQDQAPAPAPDQAQAPAPAAEPPAAPPVADQAPAVAPAPPPPSLAPPPAATEPAPIQPPAAAAAAEPIPAPPPPPSTVAPFPRFGMRLGLGIPDGVTADLVFRPLPYLRLHAGPGWNYLAFGVQGGVALAPIRWAISPVLEASYGHFFSANMNKFVKSDKNEMQSLLQDVGYDYLSGQLSLEFGSPRGFSFSLGLGLSYFWTNLHGSATMRSDPGATDPYRVVIVNPSVRAVIPSLRLGLLYYF